jgi:hypothetical protein
VGPASSWQWQTTYLLSLSTNVVPSQSSYPSSQKQSQRELPRVRGRVYKRIYTPPMSITAGDQRTSLVCPSHTSHVPSTHTSSIAVIITDSDYPVRPAFSVLNKLLDDFTSKVPQSSYRNPSAISFSEITTYIQKYQDPRQADTIMRVQQELDETKIILVCPLISYGD